MITAAELGLTTDQWSAIKDSVQDPVWKVTAYRWNLKFDTLLTSSGSNIGYDFDVIVHDDTLYRVNGNHSEKLVAGVWTNLTGAFTPVANLISNYSLVADGSDLVVFAATVTGISRTSWNGTAWSSWSEILTLAQVKYIAAVDADTLHYVVYDPTDKLWNFRVLNYSGSWSATASDIHWQYPVRAFDAVRLNGVDVLVFSAQAPGNLSSEYIDGEAVKTTVPSGGIFAFTYHYDTWSDHFTIDLVEEERSWKYRRALRASIINGQIFVSCYSSVGTQNYAYRNYRVYTSKDGKHWSRGQFLKLDGFTSYGMKLLQVNTLVYGVERDQTHVSLATLFTGDPHADTILDITAEVRSDLQISRRDMGIVRVSLSNSTQWVNTSFLNGLSTVVLKIEGGYVVEGEEVYVPMGWYEVDSVEHTEDLPDDVVELNARDYLARMADKSQSEDFIQWEPQFGGGDEYLDYTGTGKGGVGNTAVLSGSWTTPDNNLVLVSKNKEGIALSVLVSDQWNGVQEHSFTLVQTSNDEYAGVLFRAQDKDNFYGFVYDQASDVVKIIHRVSGSDTALWTGTSLSWSGSPSTRRWLRVQFRYARVVAWTSNDGITWTQRASILCPGQEDTTYDGYGYPVSTGQKMFRGLVGVIGKGYSDQDTFDYDIPTYDPPVYRLPDYPVRAVTGFLNPYTTDTVPTKMFVGASTSAQAAIATGITVGGTFVWTEISTGLSGNMLWASSDPFNYDRIFALTSTGIYTCTPFAFSGWTLVANNNTIFGNATYIGHKLIMSINRQGWIYLVSGGIEAWTTDYGVTWSRSAGTGGTWGFSLYNNDFVISPFNNGATGWMYKCVDAGGGVQQIYKSTDWGVNWTNISSISGFPWWGARLNIPYKRPGGTLDNANDSSQVLYIQSGWGHPNNGGLIYKSVDGGVSWSSHYSYGGAPGQYTVAGSYGGNALQTFTYDGAVILSATLIMGAGGSNVGIRVEDTGVEVAKPGLISVGASNLGSVCVNGFSYHRLAGLMWNQGGTNAELNYTIDGGVNTYSVNLPSFFTGSPQLIGYAEWSLIDQWNPPS